MKHMPTVAGLLTLVVCLSAVRAMPAPDEDRYFDKEYARELASWLGAVAAQTNSIPVQCQPYYAAFNNPGVNRGFNGNPYNNNALNPYQTVKRNSELINSILSLPKNMNDAGK